MNETTEQIITPPRLGLGDTIGLITPAGPVHDRETVQTGIDILEAAGFRVKMPPEMERQEYLAGTDQARAQQLAAVWHDPEVRAILAVRGGYGTMRLWPYLDPAKLAAEPKILAGFSDITILLNEIQRRTGLITYHTPVLSTLPRCDAASRRSFLAMLTGPAQPITDPDLQILTSGSAKGRLIGGNLASLCHLLGTPYEPVWDKAILFLEDVGEPPYKIDRMLTQLEASGRLPLLSGLILGTFSDEDGAAGKKEWEELIWDRARELTRGLIPLWGNFPVGHGARNQSLPVGMPAVMNSREGKLEFTSL